MALNSRCLVVAATLFLMSCAQAPDPNLMVVGPASGSAHTVHEVLVVDAVQGGQDTNPIDVPKLGNKEFHHALVASLRNAGLFDDVVADRSGRLRLSATIEHQELSGVWENLQQLAVAYKIVDDGTGETVWTETFHSIEAMDVSDVFVGQERMRRLLEAVVHDNLTQLIAALADDVARNPVFVSQSPS